mgnify:CR=1 FL=1
MNKVGIDYPTNPRDTALRNAEEWYQQFLAKQMKKKYKPIKRRNFGQYNMAVNYLTSVLEEAKAINKVAVFNIDHMVQIKFSGKDALQLLNRVLPAPIDKMKIGYCKYTLILTKAGTVIDDVIIMRLDENEFIMVSNAGHDITDSEKGLVSDADYIASFKKKDENVNIEDISNQLVKIDIQGKYSYKLITKLYGNSVVKNRYKPNKNMRFFTFNEFDFEGNHYILSRTGYTNRWGWELYVPEVAAEEQFKRIVKEMFDLGGLVAGLGARDENRISAGNVGLPLMGNEYDREHTPINAPLFDAAIDMDKDNFVGKEALEKEINKGVNKAMVLFISEGIVVNRGIYKNGKRLGSVTSSIISPNVPQEKREYLNSKRKNVNRKDGTAAIGLGWLFENPYKQDEKGNDILKEQGKPIRIRVEFYREDKNNEPKGKPIIGYISADGVNPATSYKPLRHIQNL